MPDRDKPLNYTKIINYVFLLAALTILADSYWPGKSHKSTIERIAITYEPYFNAAGNGHNSYSIITQKHSFYIDEDEKDDFSEGSQIDYRLSPIFKEVQQFESNGYQGKLSSLRIYTGTLFPLFFITVILFSFRIKRKLSILLFVVQVALIANLVYLFN